MRRLWFLSPLVLAGALPASVACRTPTAAAPTTVHASTDGGTTPPPPTAAAPTGTTATRAEAVDAGPPPPPVAPLPAVPVAVSTVAAVKVEPSWAGCARSARADGRDATADAAAAAHACEGKTKMKRLGETVTTTQADRDSPQAFPLAAKANHCYRVYAAGGAGVVDVDVAIHDSAGITLAEASTGDGTRRVVPADGAVCFHRDDKANVVISVGRGSGACAFQIWQD